MRKFKIKEFVNNVDEFVYKNAEFEIDTGLTVLVGCNGSGKTTLLKEIRRTIEDEDNRVFYFSGKDGPHQALEMSIYHKSQGAFEMASLIGFSEGETIMNAIGIKVRELAYLVHHCESKELWILLDSLDSGWSIDNIVYFKEFIDKTLIPDCPSDLDLYIVVAANSYEFTVGSTCIDVQSQKNVTFESYDDYKKFILDSADIKSKRKKKSSSGRGRKRKYPR